MKTYKQFVIESNTARDNLYEVVGLLKNVWQGARVVGSAAQGLGLGAGLGGGLGLGLSYGIPHVLNKTGNAKPVADFTRNIPFIGAAAENANKSHRAKENSSGDDDPKKDDKPKKDDTPKKDDDSNPRCPEDLTYVPATKTSKHDCVRK